LHEIVGSNVKVLDCRCLFNRRIRPVRRDQRRQHHAFGDASECAKKNCHHCVTNIRRMSRLHNECAVARAGAPEISPMIDRVIERLNAPNHRLS
jgi:hypothetical protein